MPVLLSKDRFETALLAPCLATLKGYIEMSKHLPFLNSMQRGSHADGDSGAPPHVGIEFKYFRRLTVAFHAVFQGTLWVKAPRQTLFRRFFPLSVSLHLFVKMIGRLLHNVIGDTKVSPKYDPALK